MTSLMRPGGLEVKLATFRMRFCSFSVIFDGETHPASLKNFFYAFTGASAWNYVGKANIISHVIEIFLYLLLIDFGCCRGKRHPKQ